MEAMPIAWLEGMSLGKAVVGSKTGPGPEIIQDGMNGLLCDPYDPHSIAEKINLLLDNEELRHRLGKTARQTAIEKFSVNIIVEKNIAFYEGCIRNSA
jgi:glycosyltransferase involved in cell wall biosynthesis